MRFMQAVQGGGAAIEKAQEKLKAATGMGFQDRLRQILEDRITHYVLIALLVVDVLCVIASGFLEMAYVQSKFEESERITIACIEASSGRRLGESAVACALPHHYGNVALHEAEVALIYVSIAILGIFLLEHALETFATSCKHLSDWRHVVDIAVVAVSMGIEVAALSKPAIAVTAGAIAFARLWRYARIIHGAAEVVEDAVENA